MIIDVRKGGSSSNARWDKLLLEKRRFWVHGKGTDMIIEEEEGPSGEHQADLANCPGHLKFI